MQQISAGLGAIGLLALAAAGFISFTTPKELECQQDLTDVRIELAGKNARLDLLTEAKDACKDALIAVTQKEPK